MENYVCTEEYIQAGEGTIYICVCSILSHANMHHMGGVCIVFYPTKIRNSQIKIILS